MLVEMTLVHSSGRAGQHQRASGHAPKLRPPTCPMGRCRMGVAVPAVDMLLVTGKKNVKYLSIAKSE